MKSVKHLSIQTMTKSKDFGVTEFNSKEIYKLTIVNNSDIIQGLLSLTVEKDHVLMNLLESAPFNIGKEKLYEGVAGNLVAYACKISFHKVLTVM